MKVYGRKVVLKSLVGSHNYNLANEESDKDYKVFVTPTFDDLYESKKFSKQIIGESEDNDIKDIRKLIELLFKANVNYLEVLASNEIIVPENNPEIEEIIKLKKEIFKMNLPYLYNACKGMYFNKMKLLDKGTEGTQHLVEKYGYDTKQALHAYRTMKVIVDFAETDFQDFEGAIRYNGNDLDFMMEVRNGFFKKEVFENFANHFYESTFTHLANRYTEQSVNLELKEYLEHLVMKLVKDNMLFE
ncbi:nucleotidyltransferase domain-containing protein [Bacillus subtilis]|uniref:Nucleotidyltransferase n=1 Tax=Bacillus phage vB_BsuS_PJN02 TaxID=2920374 RepID=A0AC61TRY1_9CAUD|nr:MULTISPECIES: nucleotidyltransferase domain-containing protein [Bacillus subtilis group]YP_010681728.1 nucleotidyltransferase [Bacillus phage vB_BsuS_PJN02]MCR4362036.1 nucleotidyltransferase domain-containing protein [Bacillus subtilis]UNH58453.1 putative nucleotidyltransferase [Bacillus phage vB_BsuS_PJN02]UQB84348.1 nucleotidyltransferase domain-containing protein [Bacillus amyloliquefaciens]WOF32985.1 nucleotidyltransferase domain-containing protein [Bacillus subtilis]